MYRCDQDWTPSLNAVFFTVYSSSRQLSFERTTHKMCVPLSPVSVHDTYTAHCIHNTLSSSPESIYKRQGAVITVSVIKAHRNNVSSQSRH